MHILGTSKLHLPAVPPALIRITRIRFWYSIRVTAECSHAYYSSQTRLQSVTHPPCQTFQKSGVSTYIIARKRCLSTIFYTANRSNMPINYSIIPVVLRNVLRKTNIYATATTHIAAETAIVIVSETVRISTNTLLAFKTACAIIWGNKLPVR